MKLYTCTDHEGHYPVGTASIVIADDICEAKQLLLRELSKIGIDEPDLSLEEVTLNKKQAIILNDGDY